MNFPSKHISNRLHRMIDSSREINPDGGLVKTPLVKRLKRSKFAKLINKFTDEQLKHLVYCLAFDPQLKEAIDCFTKAGGADVQIAAMIFELEERNIILNR